MKRIFVVAVAAVMACLSAGAQNYEFVPGWYVGAQLGAQYTAGESTIANLTSPTASINVGYQFNPWFGLRGNINGIQGKGWMSIPYEGYKFNYAQAAIDATIGLANFGEFKPHIVNPYIFVGVGDIYGFNNEPLKKLVAMYPTTTNAGLMWDKGVNSLLVRAGAGIDFRLSDRVLLGLEVADNAFSDKLNSKEGPYAPKDFDWNLSAQLGVKVALGETYKTRYAAAQAAAAAEAARLAAEKAEQDRIAAEKAAAEKAAAEKAAAEKAAAEKAAAEKAAAEKAAAEKAAAEAEYAKDLCVQNIYFLLDKTNIRKCEMPKIDEIVKCLNANPEAKVKVQGHADLPTGSHPHNNDLSKARAEKVAKAIEKAGIAKDRIIVEYFGDTANPFPVQEENRVSVCTVNRTF